MGANAIMSGVISDDKLAKLVKRAFSLPKQIWLLTSRPKKELVLALQQIGYDVLVTDSLHVSAEVQQHLAPDLMVVVIMEALLLQLSMNNTIKKTQV